MDYLNLIIGNNWKTDVKNLLGKYGRGALRQSYSWYTFSGTIDEETLAEQWFEWQLDMYYMDKYKLDLKEYYNTSEDLLKIKYDPRDPDLIGTVEITKSSLNAFSILENTATLDADYAYRDFKELIVELNYFDKEDLSSKIEKVFTWVLPDVDCTGWPVRPWDKQEVEYGTLIESKATYTALGLVSSTSSTGETSSEEPEEPTTEEPEEPEVPEVDPSRVLTDEERNCVIYCIQYQIAGGSEINIEWFDKHGFPTADDYNELADLLWKKAYETNGLYTIMPYSGYEVEWFKTWGYERGLVEEEEEPTEEPTEEGTTVGSTSSIFQGYTADQLVASPVTGKILEIGTHERTNIYTGETEEVEYIIIEVINKEAANLVGESFDLFYKEYSDVCANEEGGYTIMIDGLDVDLSVTDSEVGENGTPTEEQIEKAKTTDKEEEKVLTYKTEDGTYKTNKVYGLYNSAEREKRFQEEISKANAKFFVNYGEAAGYPKEGYVASSGVTGYYVKEGKYIGKTISSYTEESLESAELEDKLTYEYSDFTEIPDFPAEYMRIQVNDTEFGVVEDVEKYFNIPISLAECTNTTGDCTAIESINDSSTTEDRIKAIMSYLISQGFTVEAAAGVCGNIAVECQYNEKCIFHYRGSIYYGLCQWNYKDGSGRWAKVAEWIAEQGYNQSVDNTMASFAGQLRAAIECPDEGAHQFGSQTNFDKMKTFTNEEEAAAYWDTKFERSGGSSLALRKSEAVYALKVWNGESYSGKKPYRN